MKTGFIPIDSNNLAGILHQFPDERRLSARRRAQVDDSLSRFGVGQKHGDAGTFILHREISLLEEFRLPIPAMRRTLRKKSRYFEGIPQLIFFQQRKKIIKIDF